MAVTNPNVAELHFLKQPAVCVESGGVNAYRAVVYNGIDVELPAAKGDHTAGITNASIAEDAAGTIVQIGRARIELGGTLSAGADVVADTDGRAVAASEGEHLLGVLLTGGSAGDIAIVEGVFFDNRQVAIDAILDGLTASVAEINILDDFPASITFAAAAGAANVTEVTITVRDAAGVAIDKAFMLDVWLSDAATGAGLTGTEASGTVTAKAASGAIIATHVSKKALKVQTLATGVFVLEITDTAKTDFYVGASLGPILGVSDVLETADYGA